MSWWVNAWSNFVRTGSYCSPAMCWYATLRSSSRLTCQPERFRKPSKPWTQPHLNSCTYTEYILWFVSVSVCIMYLSVCLYHVSVSCVCLSVSCICLYHVSVFPKTGKTMAPGSLEHTKRLSYVKQSHTATNTASIGQLTVAELHVCHGMFGPADCKLIL